jgi:hypothetical protein
MASDLKLLEHPLSEASDVGFLHGGGASIGNRCAVFAMGSVWSPSPLPLDGICPE